MSYCLNPQCHQPINPRGGQFCQTCGYKLLLKQRYRAIKPIGQGGFGKTFLAIDEDKPSQPYCVIKQFYPQIRERKALQKATELFNREAVRLEELGQHPQIPNLFAYFTQDNRQYLIQEFINGQNLAQELAQVGNFNEDLVSHLLFNLLPVLQFCHTRNIIHRDIKPDNIIRRQSIKKSSNSSYQIGNLVLVDFGASKSTDPRRSHQPGTSIGSPEYVSPEQLQGKAGLYSDIYSLGVTCIHLLTGRSPFDLYDTHHDRWIWQKYLQQTISQDLVIILNKMLARTPAYRYQSTQQVMTDLQKYQGYQKGGLIQPGLREGAESSLANYHPSSTPTSIQSYQTIIDRELEEIRTTFLGHNQPVAPEQSQQTNSHPDPPISRSKVDEELEEIRRKYLGNEE